MSTQAERRVQITLHVHLFTEIRLRQPQRVAPQDEIAQHPRVAEHQRAGGVLRAQHTAVPQPHREATGMAAQQAPHDVCRDPPGTVRSGGRFTPRLGTRRRGHQPGPGPPAGTGAAGSFRRRSSAELTITDSEDSAIAAAAMMGLRNPSAAMGTPMAL